MNTVRELRADEYQKWDDFVAKAPLGSLFHTTKWNQMISRTTPNADVLILASLNEKEVIQAGIIVSYCSLKGKKIVDLPQVGYVFPILSSELHYEDRHHTYGNYLILVDLIKELRIRVDYVRLKNAPGFWDVRPYFFQSWRIETAYTHLWQSENSVQPEENSMLKLGINVGWEDLYKVIKVSGDLSIFQERLQWLRDEDLCRLFVAMDQQSRPVGMCLVILSWENKTVYVWDVGCVEPRAEDEILPFLFRQCWQNLVRDFSCIDLGISSHANMARIKDRLGCDPVPCFVTSFG